MFKNLFDSFIYYVNGVCTENSDWIDCASLLKFITATMKLAAVVLSILLFVFKIVYPAIKKDRILTNVYKYFKINVLYRKISNISIKDLFSRISIKDILRIQNIHFGKKVTNNYNYKYNIYLADPNGEYEIKGHIISQKLAVLGTGTPTNKIAETEVSKNVEMLTDIKNMMYALEAFDAKTEKLKKIAYKYLENNDSPNAYKAIEEYTKHIKSRDRGHYIEVSNSLEIQAKILESQQRPNFEKASELYHEAAIYIKEIDTEKYTYFRVQEAKAHAQLNRK